MRLKEKVINVTGSSQGIGEAIARRAVREGARVLVHGLERELGEKVVADLGDAARLHIEDLADPACPEHLVENTVEAFGRLDCIVNNAAWVARSDIATTDADYFDRVMAINARAPLLLIRAGLAQLSTHRGCVLNIGSVNEDFAVESIAGDIFQLGNTSYRILRVEAGKVRVEDAQGQPPTIPFWLGEAPGRSNELSVAVARLQGQLDSLLGATPGVKFSSAHA